MSVSYAAVSKGRISLLKPHSVVSVHIFLMGSFDSTGLANGPHPCTIVSISIQSQNVDAPMTAVLALVLLVVVVMVMMMVITICDNVKTKN